MYFTEIIRTVGIMNAGITNGIAKYLQTHRHSIVHVTAITLIAGILVL